MRRFYFISFFCFTLLSQSFVYCASTKGPIKAIFANIFGVARKPFGRIAEGQLVGLDRVQEEDDLITFGVPFGTDEPLRASCEKKAVVVFEVLYPGHGTLFFLKKSDGEAVAKEHAELMGHRGFIKVER